MSNPYNMHSGPRERAKSHLAHYLEMAIGDGMLAPDNFAEIGEIVDAIIEAATEGLKADVNNLREWLTQVEQRLDGKRPGESSR